MLETSTFLQNNIISVAAAKVLGSLLHFDIADGQAALKIIGFTLPTKKSVHIKPHFQYPKP